MNNFIQTQIDLCLNNDSKPEDILFFTGAGISVAPPSNFPLGNVLHRMILELAEKFNKYDAIALSEKLVFEETISRLAKLYNSQNIDSNIFLDHLSNIFIVSDDDKQRRLKHQPNDYHKFFNWHINQGGKHFTVNLDQFIEAVSLPANLTIFTKDRFKDGTFSYSSNLIPVEGLYLKIHGDSNKDEWGKQGYLFENVQPFDNDFASWIDKRINTVKFVIFVGYGGVDKFDITPYFNSKQNGFFKYTNALWIQYEGTEILQIPNQITTAMDTILSKFNKHIVIETTKPELILNNLFKDSPIIKNTTKDNCRNGVDVEEYLKSKFQKFKIIYPTTG